MSRPAIPPEQRFWKFVDRSGDCWEWTGNKSKGYGRFHTDRAAMAHRFSWELHRGPIPEGLQLDHLCRNRACVNPDHLEPVTAQVNTQRGEPAMRTHCPKGHAYDEANTLIRRCGRRACRKCLRLANQRRRQRPAEIPQ